VCYCTWCAALVLLDVVGSGCGALRCRMRAPRLLMRYSLIEHAKNFGKYGAVLCQ